jgi:outer membrane usher protein
MRPSRRHASAAAIVIAALLIDPATRCAASEPAMNLHLEVMINGASTRQIAEFHQRADGALAIAPGELYALGLEGGAIAGADGLVNLGQLPGVTYRYDEVAQVIRLEVPDRVRRASIVEARTDTLRGSEEPNRPRQRAWGALVNYSLFAAAGSTNGASSAPGASGTTASATLEARAFGPLGILSQSGIVQPAVAGDDFLRLDTTWSYADPATLVTYRAGDFISGGLPWTRPVRLFGFQMQRSFALRPDLVTMPSPLLRGTAAVPSTVDVYVNNIRALSQNLPAGPFEVQNIPVMSGAGTQRVVVRDSSGRETTTNQAFYASANLLRPGLFDFSAEAGYRRISYGADSNDYNGDPVASGTLRYGLSDRLTLEAHGEGGGDTLNGGFGLATPIGSIGVGSLSLAGSRAQGQTGAQYAAALEFGIGNISLYLRTQRTAGAYADIATVLPRPQDASGAAAALTSLRPAKALDQVALAVPIGRDRSTITLSYTGVEDATTQRFDILGLSYSRRVFGNASFYAMAYRDFGDQRALGVFCGLTLPLGQSISASTGVTGGSSGIGTGVDVIKSQPLEPGTSGWRLSDREGATVDRLATASYRAPAALVQAQVEQSGSSSRAAVQADGAIAIAGGGVFFANRIDDAFAVVDVGAPGVTVSRENHAVGVTNGAGLLLVPNLAPNQANRLTIDTKALPVDAEIPRTRASVTPVDRNGAVIRFGISTQRPAALLTVRGRDGMPLPAGAQGIVRPSGERFAVGYDGQAFVRGLAVANTIVVKLVDGGACSGAFAFAPRKSGRNVVNVTCQ